MERITGYSIGTISRAFNQNYPINPTTRDLILSKAKEIGYSPHAGARNLTQGKTHRWGLLLPHLHNPRFSELMDYLDMEARQRDTLLLLGLSRYDASMEAKLALHWASGEADGMIADACIDSSVFEQLHRRKFPIVFLFAAPSARFNVVTTDTASCFTQLMERFIEAGHRRIGFVNHAYPARFRHPAEDAYRRVSAQHGIAPDESLVFFGSRDYLAGPEAWAHWRRAKNRPTAVLCRNDLIACTFIKAAQADGCRIPRDLSVTGSDDVSVAALCDLTTIRTDPEAIAREAFALLERPYTRRGEVRSVPSVLVERDSIGPVPARAAAETALETSPALR